MSEQNKQINVRLINKYDTEEKWKEHASEYVAPAGELVISAPDEISHNYPTIRVGDSKNSIANLPIINPQPSWTQVDGTAPDFIVGKPPIEKSDDNGVVIAGPVHASESVYVGQTTAILEGEICLGENDETSLTSEHIITPKIYVGNSSEDPSIVFRGEEGDVELKMSDVEKLLKFLNSAVIEGSEIIPGTASIQLVEQETTAEE